MSNWRQWGILGSSVNKYGKRTVQASYPSSYAGTSNNSWYVSGVEGYKISPIAGLMPAEAGADVTGQNTAKDTAAVNGTAAATVQGGAARGYNAIDSGNVVIPTGIDFSRSYTNKQLDNIPDGATYARPLSTRINAGRPWIDFAEGIHSNKNADNIAETGNNLHLKPALQTQIGQRSESANLLHNWQWTENLDFWDTSNSAGIPSGYPGRMECHYAVPASGSTYHGNVQIDERGNTRYFPVTPGDNVALGIKVRLAGGTANGAYVQLALVDANLANDTENVLVDSGVPTSSFSPLATTGVVPPTINSGAVPAFGYFKFQYNMNAGDTATAVDWSNPYLRIGHQTLIDSGGAQLGSGLNLFGLNSAGYATAYWSGITMTPGPGSMAISAGTLHVGGETVSYNSSSISLLGYSTTYSFFYNDKDYAGGSQTLQATTTKQTLINNDGYIYIGDGTTQSSGGTGGGGTISTCLAFDMFIRPNVPAVMACVGQKFDAYDKFKALGERTLLNAWTATGTAVRITTSNGSVLDCGEDTPFDLKDGTSKLAKDMLGETVITDGGEDTVTSVKNLGVIPLVYVSGGGVTIMAGADPKKRIGSHNTMKP